MNIKVDIILLTSRKRNADNRHPVVLRLMEGRERKYKRLGYYYHIDEWDSSRNQPKNGNTEVIRVLMKEQTKYLDKISKMKADGENVSLDTIMADVNTNRQPAKVLAYFQKVIGLLKSESIGNSDVYQCAYKSLKTFLYAKQNKLDLTDPKNHQSEEALRATKDIKFAELNKTLLDQYSEWLDKRNANPRTKAVYFRTLKALFNKAIYDPDIKLSASLFPFGKKEDKSKFAISQFSKKTKKRAITSVDIAKIKALDLSAYPLLDEARDYFLFGLYGMGIDFVDIARLTWGNYNLRTSRISYVRYKTRRKTDELIDFEVDEYILPIINKYRPKDRIPKKQEYIFSKILNFEFHVDEVQIHSRINKVITRINRDLKKISDKAEIYEPLSTKWTRHTFASILKLEVKASINEISELLRHGDVKTTEIYLKELEVGDKDATVKKMKQITG